MYSNSTAIEKVEWSGHVISTNKLQPCSVCGKYIDETTGKGTELRIILKTGKVNRYVMHFACLPTE
jgi:hypothetical protein